MKIHLEDARNLEDIQAEFHEKYPFLKLEFFSKPHAEGEASHGNDLIDGNPTLGEIRTKHNEGDLKFDAQTTVGDLEQNFWNTYGVSVQVFRKSGRQWLETSATDHWTLEKQDEEAREMAKRIPTTIASASRD